MWTSNIHKIPPNLPLSKGGKTPLFAKEGNTSLNPLLIEGNLSSLCQREGKHPSLAKRGEGRFSE